MKKSILNLSGAIFYAIPVAAVLALFTVPYKHIIANRYIQEHYYHTIISFFQENFLKILPFSLFTLIIIATIFRKKKLSGLKYIKYTASILIALTFITFIFTTLKKLKKSPNVVLIVVDTLRDDHTSFENPAKKTTEKIKNSLGTDAVYFSNAHSNSPWTLPSVSSLMTSKYPSSLGIRNLVSKIPEREITIAEKLKEEGYKTGAIVSHILLKKIYGFSQGFDEFNENNISDELGNHYSISSPGITKDALKYIDKNCKKKFFLFLHYFDPHYIYIDHWKKSGYRGSFTSKDISFLREKVRKKEYGKEDIDYLKYSYDSEIAFTDRFIAEVIEELKRKKIYENTLLIITSDHGEEFVERGWLGHSTGLNNEQTSVPMVIKPQFKKNPVNEKSEKNVSNLDIFPTICSFIGIKPPSGIHGMNIFNSKNNERPFYAEVSQKEFGSHIELISVIWKNWKLIKDLGRKSYTLYDIHKDPLETANVYKIKTGVESKLKIMIKKWERKFRAGRRTVRRKKPLDENERKRLKSLGYIN